MLDAPVCLQTWCETPASFTSRIQRVKPNAVTLAWLMQQAKTNEFSALLPADPSVTDVREGRTAQDVSSNRHQIGDEPGAEDFDALLARLRRLFIAEPARALAVETWLAQIAIAQLTKADGGAR